MASLTVDSGEIGTKPHLKINDLDLRLASRHQYFCGGVNSLSNAGNINSSQIEHAALSAKVILHVVDNDRSLCDIDRNRFGLCWSVITRPFALVAWLIAAPLAILAKGDTAIAAASI